jgi:hypothetical protein
LDLVVGLAALAGLLILVPELFRRADKWTAWGAFFVLPLALAPYWNWLGQAGAYGEAGAFPWVKLVSVQFYACWLTALRFTPLGKSRWASGALFLMLPLNMLEAVLQDAFGGHLAHYLLGLSGILLIFSVPHPMKAIRIDTDGRYRELRYVGMTRTWVAGYTLWNAAFVYLNFPAIAGHELAVLASAFAIGMVDPSRWLQARTFTLATDLLALASFPNLIVPFTDTSHWASPHGENLVAGACLAIVAVYAGYIFFRRADRVVARYSRP